MRAQAEAGPTTLNRAVDELRFSRPSAPVEDSAGPFTHRRGEYKERPRVERGILPDRTTELYAEVWMPDLPSGVRAPVVVILHGNHLTCRRPATPSPRTGTDAKERKTKGSQSVFRDFDAYAYEGTCNPGWEHVPSHRGYGYIAERMVARGFAVVSINADLGIAARKGPTDDPALIRARARLLLTHLARLSAWDRGQGHPAGLEFGLQHRLDLGRVLLVGHSRGGEAVRAAYALLDAQRARPSSGLEGVGIRGIFEIAPTDTSTPPFDAMNVPRAAFVPACDEDTGEPLGQRAHDRMRARLDETRPSPKAVFWVWGADHASSNTEWGPSPCAPDWISETTISSCSPRGCPKEHRLFEGDASAQRQVVSTLVERFARGVLRGEQAQLEALDPAYALDVGVERAHIERDYVPAMSKRDLTPWISFDDAGAYGLQAVERRGDVTTEPVRLSREPGQSVLGIRWRPARAGDGHPNVEILRRTISRNEATDPPSAPPDRLDLGVRLGGSEETRPPGGSSIPLDFGISLLTERAGMRQRTAAVRLRDFGELIGPLEPTNLFQTISIPLDLFGDIDPGEIVGLRLDFDGTPGGSLVLRDAHFRRDPRSPVVLPPATLPFEPRATPRADLSPVGAKPARERSPLERRLHADLARIVASNPEIFRGPLAEDQFRFEEDPDLERMAAVDLRRLVIRVSPSFAKRTRSDAERAAILCHEVSHAIRGHLDFSPPPPSVAQDPRYRAQNARVELARERLAPERAAGIYRQFDDATERFAARMGLSVENGGRAALRERLDPLANANDSPEARAYRQASQAERKYNEALDGLTRESAALRRVMDEILFEPGASSNWDEQEADELGLRLFVRSGFSPSAFLETLVHTLDHGKGELPRYLETLRLARDPTSIPVPERGFGDHPAPKWRIYNLAIRELALRYPAQYAALEKNAARREHPGDSSRLTGVSRTPDDRALRR